MTIKITLMKAKDHLMYFLLRRSLSSKTSPWAAAAAGSKALLGESRLCKELFEDFNEDADKDKAEIEGVREFGLESGASILRTATDIQGLSMGAGTIRRSLWLDGY